MDERYLIEILAKALQVDLGMYGLTELVQSAVDRVAELKLEKNHEILQREMARGQRRTVEARVARLERVRDKVDEECVMLRQFHEDHQDDETGAARVNELTRERNEERDRVATLERRLGNYECPEHEKPDYECDVCLEHLKAAAALEEEMKEL